MARTRWNRYKSVNGVVHKKCDGPLHPEEGVWLPLEKFWIFKNGKRAGHPISRCMECERVIRGRDPKVSGFTELDRVWWIFVEIRNRVGKMEACRLLGFGEAFWTRSESGQYTRIRKSRVRKAILVLHDLRERDVVRHRDSIRHGAAQRGRKEKVVTSHDHLYKPHGDRDAENQRKARR